MDSYSHFPDVAFQPGTLKAIGKNNDKVVCQHELVTAGAPARLKLTPIVGPDGLLPTARMSRYSMSKSSTPKATDAQRTTIESISPAPAPPPGAADTTAENSAQPTTSTSTPNVASIASPSAQRRVAGTITIVATRKGIEPAQAVVVSKAVKVRGWIGGCRPKLFRRFFLHTTEPTKPACNNIGFDISFHRGRQAAGHLARRD